MGQYGKVALNAYELAENGLTPLAAWESAVASLASKSSREKMCPKAIFFGVCNAGLLIGVPKQPGNISKNAEYGRIAVYLLNEDSAWSASPKADLWSAVMRQAGEPATKRQNGQLDVVLALWNAGHIEKGQA